MGEGESIQNGRTGSGKRDEIKRKLKDKGRRMSRKR